MSDEIPRSTHAYAGYCTTCGVMNAATVDFKGGEREVAKFIAMLVRRGQKVERVTIEDVRAKMHFCECHKLKRKRKASAQIEAPL